MDLDVGLTAALLDRGTYREISDRLRRPGFAQDENDAGNPTRQRWKIVAREKVTIDFLMPPTSPDDRGGSLRDLEPDFAAVVAPGCSWHSETASCLALGPDDRRRRCDPRHLGLRRRGLRRSEGLGLRPPGREQGCLRPLLRSANYGAAGNVVECLRPLLDDESRGEGDRNPAARLPGTTAWVPGASRSFRRAGRTPRSRRTSLASWAIFFGEQPDPYQPDSVRQARRRRRAVVFMSLQTARQGARQQCAPTEEEQTTGCSGRPGEPRQAARSMVETVRKRRRSPNLLLHSVSHRPPSRRFRERRSSPSLGGDALAE